MEEVRIWDGNRHPEPGKERVCHTCDSKENVKHATVKVRQGGCVKSCLDHVHAYLCLECQHKGWIIFADADPAGTICYYNLKTKEFKYSK